MSYDELSDEDKEVYDSLKRTFNSLEESELINYVSVVKQLAKVSHEHLIKLPRAQK